MCVAWKSFLITFSGERTHKMLRRRDHPYGGECLTPSDCGGSPPPFESGAKAPHSEGARKLLPL